MRCPASVNSKLGAFMLLIRLHNSSIGIVVGILMMDNIKGLLLKKKRKENSCL